MKKLFLDMNSPVGLKVERSELSDLLDKNLTKTGLTPDEFERARDLILNPEYSETRCLVCRFLVGASGLNEEKTRAIYDTGLCQGHASYGLIARK